MTEQRYTEVRHKLTGKMEFDKHESDNYYRFFERRALAVEETERTLDSNATARQRKRWEALEGLAKDNLGWLVVLALIVALSLVLHRLIAVQHAETLNQRAALPKLIATCASGCPNGMHAFRNYECECK